MENAAPLIQYPPNDHLFITRACYLAICDNNRCAAALLANFEYWHRNRVRAMEQERNREKVFKDFSRPGDEFVFKSYRDLAKDLLGSFGRNAICDGLALLQNKGFVEAQSSPDPSNRTKFYRFHVPAVQSALNSLPADYLTGIVLEPIISSEQAGSGQRFRTTLSEDGDHSLNLNDTPICGDSLKTNDPSFKFKRPHSLNLNSLYKESEITSTEITAENGVCVGGYPPQGKENLEESPDLDSSKETGVPPTKVKNSGEQQSVEKLPNQTSGETEDLCKVEVFPLPPTPFPNGQLTSDSCDDIMQDPIQADEFIRSWRWRVKGAKQFKKPEKETLIAMLDKCDMTATELEAAFQNFLRSEFGQENNYPARTFCKNPRAWGGSRQPPTNPRREADSGVGAIARPHDKKRPVPVTTIRPRASNGDLATIWNEQVPAGARAGALTSPVSDGFRERFSDVCQKAQAILESDPTASWVTLPWLLKTKEGFADPNWQRLLKGEFDYLLKAAKPQPKSLKELMDGSLARLRKEYGISDGTNG